MRLTRFTDNALRALIFLALEPTQVPTVGHVARQMGMSEDHLLKVVQRLSQLGYVQTIRGRKGGMRLAKPADQIVVGTVIRQTEDNIAMASCFEPDSDRCPIVSACALAPAFELALQSFFATLDRYTVADLTVRNAELVQLTQRSATPTIAA